MATTTSMSLPQFPAGSRVRIEKLCECPKARGRLCALGLTPGTLVEVCSQGPGPCLLKVRGSNVAIGHGMASRVYGHDVASENATCPCGNASSASPPSNGGNGTSHLS